MIIYMVFTIIMVFWDGMIMTTKLYSIYWYWIIQRKVVGFKFSPPINPNFFLFCGEGVEYSGNEFTASKILFLVWKDPRRQKKYQGSLTWMGWSSSLFVQSFLKLKFMERVKYMKIKILAINIFQRIMFSKLFLLNKLAHKIFLKIYPGFKVDRYE